MIRLLIALFMLAATQAQAGEATMPITGPQRALTSHPVWLNTSRALTPEDLRGRIVLVDFWTLGCINCMDIIPDLKALEHEFGDKLTVIGVHSAKFANEKDTANIRSAVLRYGLTHPVTNDADFSIWNTFGVRAWPTLVLMTPAGLVMSSYSGEGHRADLEADIRAVIDKYDGRIVTAPLPIALESSKQPDTVLRFPGKVTAGQVINGIAPWTRALFVADSGHNRILMIHPQNGAILDTIGDGREGLRDGNAMQAEFFKPQGMAYDEKNNLLYVADLGNHALRVIDLKKRTVATLAGTGAQGHALSQVGEKDALATALTSPWDIAFWPDEHHIAIAMAGAHQLWSYDIANHTVSLLAGNGQESIGDGQYPFNSLAQPSGLLVAGDKLYFTDAESSALRVMDKAGNVTTLIGKGLFDFGYKEGGRDTARLQHCLGLTGDDKNLYIADTYNHSIRRYDIAQAKLYDYAGHGERGTTDGALAQASFNEPGGIALLGDMLYVADTDNNILRAINRKEKQVSTLSAMPQAQATPEPGGLPQNLPNLTKLSFAVAPEKPVTVTLELKPGWHINHDAPSQLALYLEADTSVRKAMFDKKALAAGPLTLNLEGNSRLMGTLYFCADQAASLCMIKSFDATLTPSGTDTKIALPLN